MMPSDERAYKNKLKEAEDWAKEQWWMGIRKAVEVINRCKWLTEEQKTELLEELRK